MQTGEPGENQQKQTWTGNQMHVRAGTVNRTRNWLVQSEGRYTMLTCLSQICTDQASQRSFLCPCRPELDWLGICLDKVGLCPSKVYMISFKRNTQQKMRIKSIVLLTGVRGIAPEKFWKFMIVQSYLTPSSLKFETFATPLFGKLKLFLPTLFWAWKLF